MIPYANTVIYPRTMVIKPFHAFVTNIAMSTSFSSDNFAVRAQMISIESFNNFEKINTLILL